EPVPVVDGELQEGVGLVHGSSSVPWAAVPLAASAGAGAGVSAAASAGEIGLEQGREYFQAPPDDRQRSVAEVDDHVSDQVAVLFGKILQRFDDAVEHEPAPLPSWRRPVADGAGVCRGGSRLAQRRGVAKGLPLARSSARARGREGGAAVRLPRRRCAGAARGVIRVGKATPVMYGIA